MALKMGTPAPKTGVDYSSHLGTAKPIVSNESVVKKHAGEPEPQAITTSKTEHPGVFTDGHTITVEASRTINLGDFNSARMGVTLTVPTTKDSLNEAYEWATDWVSNRIEAAVKDAISDS